MQEWEQSWGLLGDFVFEAIGAMQVEVTEILGDQGCPLRRPAESKCIQGFLPSEPNLLEETFDAISIMHWLQHEGGTFLDSRFGFPILPGRSWEPGGNPHVPPSNYQMEGENHYLTAGPGGHLEDIFLFKVILIDYYTMLNHHETEHHLGNYFFVQPP